MHGISACFTAAVMLARASAAPPPSQVPLRVNDGLQDVDKKRLHGRFLHITDFHPDPFYQIYSSTSETAACHRGQGPAGIYGAETSECDSPFALINKTMEYIAKEFRGNVDFVIWTGDSARHDNDDDVPRSKDQVLDLNRFMVQKMAEVFGKHNGDEEDDNPNNDYIVPIVPNLGNNDILPHNILDRGPNIWTRTYASLWRQFIPEAQKHSFEQGGWFYVEVVPHKLAVFSLNTLYFFGSNAAADGCAAHSEPGYQQLEWLRIQLQYMRDRGMKALLTGHVPPVRQDAKTTWDETCWQKYTLWLRQYRDVIVASHYGHFNYDHFMFQDFKDLDKDTKHGRMENYDVKDTHNDDISIALNTDYWVQLREEWSDLPQPPRIKTRSWLDVISGKKKKDKYKKKQKKYLKKMGGEYAERFAATFVSSSIVPNLFPTLRVFEYNTTGLENHDAYDVSQVPGPAPFPSGNEDMDAMKKKHKKYKFTVPEAPSKSTPPGPAYSPQTFSLTKYTQYFANLTHINNDFLSSSNYEPDVDAAKWNEGKHKGKKPHDKDHKPSPKKFKFDVLYDTQDDKIYHLDDLTMPNLIDLARRIGNFVPETSARVRRDADTVDTEREMRPHGNGKKVAKHHKENEAWYAFVRRAYVETMDPNELEDEFGH